ncbi:Hypothetical predicted protein [Olea europaea subsp. europaea]|uniref:Pentatricopeptide repeat-containing protein n=1 Tax=Olea europaea subsp. europaea TaxID=158383 RepID=A0A8S0T4J5_OLEEU|nr:Hypothetical predicted protein [Olea europaea subsp. europaea]
MVKNGLNPDTATNNTLLYECCRKDGMVEAEVPFDEMQHIGAVPNLVSYNLLIRIGATPDAMKICDEMMKNGCLVDVVGYNTI